MVDLLLNISLRIAYLTDHGDIQKITDLEDSDLIFHLVMRYRLLMEILCCHVVKYHHVLEIKINLH